MKKLLLGFILLSTPAYARWEVTTGPTTDDKGNVISDKREIITVSDKGAHFLVHKDLSCEVSEAIIASSDMRTLTCRVSPKASVTITVLSSKNANETYNFMQIDRPGSHGEVALHWIKD